MSTVLSRLQHLNEFFLFSYLHFLSCRARTCSTVLSQQGLGLGSTSPCDDAFPDINQWSSKHTQTHVPHNKLFTVLSAVSLTLFSLGMASLAIVNAFI